MKRCILPAAFLLIFMTNALPGVAQEASHSPFVSSLARQFDELAESVSSLSSTSEALIEDGKVVYSRSFGFADIESKTPISLVRRS